MKRLSLKELKSRKDQKNLVTQLEAINGGNAESCHTGTGNDSGVLFFIMSLLGATQSN